jgi:phage terminase large subunit GpA-like protein
VHFPAALTADFYEQLTAERQVTRYTKGVARLEWIKAPGKRNEALDTLVYSYAAAHRAGLARFTAGTWQTLAARPVAPTTTSGGGASRPVRFTMERGVRGRFVV